MGRRSPTSAFKRLAQMVRLLQKRGLAESKIDEILREKILADLALEERKRREPSTN